MAGIITILEKMVLPIIGAAIAYQSYTLSVSVASYEEALAEQKQAFEELLANRSLHWDIINAILKHGKECDRPKDLQLLGVVLETLPDSAMQITFLNAVRSAAKLCEDEILATTIPVSDTAPSPSDDTMPAQTTRALVNQKKKAYSGISSKLGEKIYEVQAAQMLEPPVQTEEPASSGRWGNWDVDIFHCEGYAKGKEQADILKETLISEGAVGRIRSRLLPTSVNNRSGYQVKGNQIRINDNAGEKAFGVQLTSLINTLLPDITVTEKVTAQNTPWYVSTFFCEKP